MALFRGIQEYIALDANNITLVFDSGNIVNISGNIFLYPPQGHPILYNYLYTYTDDVSKDHSKCWLDAAVDESAEATEEDKEPLRRVHLHDAAQRRVR